VRGGEVQEEGRVWKEGRGCGRWEEDVRGEIRVWEGEGRSERRGKSAKGGGGYETKEENVRGGGRGRVKRRGRVWKEGENME